MIIIPFNAFLKRCYLVVIIIVIRARAQQKEFQFYAFIVLLFAITLDLASDYSPELRAKLLRFIQIIRENITIANNHRKS